MSLYFHSVLGYCTLMCTLIPNLLQLLNGQWLNAHLNCIGINIKIYVASFICDYLTVQAIINSGSYCITLYPIRIRDTEAKCNVFKLPLLIKDNYIIKKSRRIKCLQQKSQYHLNCHPNLISQSFIKVFLYLGNKNFPDYFFAANVKNNE